MQTFDCPKCGAPVTYDPDLGGGTARCSYCQSQLALPNEYRGEFVRVIEQFEISVGPQVASGARKIISLFLLIPFFIVVVVLVVILAVFGMIGQMVRSITAPLRAPIAARGGPGGSRAGDPANSFAS